MMEKSAMPQTPAGAGADAAESTPSVPSTLPAALPISADGQPTPIAPVAASVPFGSDALLAPGVATVSPTPQGSGPLSGAAPVQPVSDGTATPVAHFFKWLCAIAGAFVAILAMQVVAAVIGAFAFAIGAAVLGANAGDVSDAVDFQMVLVIGLFTQVVWLAVGLPWWRHVSRRGIGIGGAHARLASTGERIARVAKIAAAIALLGICLQIILSMLLGLILPLFPTVEAEYETLMDSAGVDEFTVLSVLSVAIMAPVVEELTFRGIVFQFALRAVTPRWSKQLLQPAYAQLAVPTARFWVANILQALTFGLMHLNVTQFVYAFLIGLMLGWIFWRTGKLRYSIGLHLAVNFSSYFASEIARPFSAFGDLGLMALAIAGAVLALWMFARALPSRVQGSSAM